MNIEVRPLTPELWPTLVDLFGPNGASNGCWCMYWRIGSAYAKQGREKNRAAFRRIVRGGPPPGLLAFDGEIAVGWCQITPRASLPHLDRARFTKRIDDQPVWAISCLYVRRGYRRKGVTSALIEAAVEAARRGGATALEAWPVDAASPKATANLYTGVKSAFARAGFTTIAMPAPHRPTMRHLLEARTLTSPST